MASASWREKASRVKPVRALDGLTVLMARVSEDVSAVIADNVSPEALLFLAVATRESLASKTGSANTAIVWLGGSLPSVSRRITDRTEAEGRLTISCVAIKGR